MELAVDGGFGARSFIALQETHLESTPQLAGYTILHVSRNSRVNSGGNMLAIRDDWVVSESVQQEYFIAARVQRGSQVVIVASVYIPPSTSAYGPEVGHREPYAAPLEALVEATEQLRLGIASVQCPVLLLGDFNCHTGGLQGTLGRVAWQQNLQSAFTHRFTEDMQQDERGKILMALCRDNELTVLNGRTKGDPTGAITFERVANRATLDYAIASWDCQADMKVIQEAWAYSDHAALDVALTLAAPTIVSQDHTVLTSASSLLPFVLTEEGLHNFREAEHPNLQQFSEGIAADDQSPEACLQAFERALHSAACGYLEVKSIPHKGIRKLNPNKSLLLRQPWFDDECKQLKNAVHRARRCNQNQAQHSSLATAKAAFKRSLRQKKAAYLSSLEDMRISDPKSFWKVLQQAPRPCQIPLERLQAHYQRVFTPQQQVIQQDLHACLCSASAFPLSPPFSADEVGTVLNSLKTGKSRGNSWIQSELLSHHEGDGVVQAVTTLFNHFARNGIPSSWKELLFVSLFKGKGSQADPHNYRPIALMPQLCKAYAQVVLKRLEAVSEDKEWRAKGQSGFRASYRVEDNVVILKTVAERAQALHRPLYLAFVDLEKAYDKVNRQVLWQVLREELGLDPALLAQIQALYEGLVAVVVAKEGKGAAMPLDEGVKQGCPMSPLLFSILIDRLEYILDTATRAAGSQLEQGVIKLGALRLLVLLFADDMVLLAETRELLQLQLRVLEGFCASNSLKVHTGKTKVMAMNGAPLETDFEYNGQVLERVRNFCYLGLELDQYVSCRTMTLGVARRAKAAMAALRTFLRQHGWRQGATRLVLFDVYVRSVLLYGCVVWGVDISPTAAQRAPASIRQLEVMYQSGLRQLLGVHRDVRIEVLLILAVRPPVGVIIRKQVFRYYRALLEADGVKLVTQVARWADQLDNPAIRYRLGVLRGHQLALGFGSPTDIYKDYVEQAGMHLSTSQRLEGSGVVNLWKDLLQMALLDKRKNLVFDDGMSWQELKGVMGNAKCIQPVVKNGTVVTPRRLWAWPSWLLGQGSNDRVGSMLTIFYDEARWWGGSPSSCTQSRWSLLTTYDWVGWSARDRLLVKYIISLGLATVVWLDCVAVMRLIPVLQ